MADSGSFIPKQQPRTAPKVRRRRVYVVSYVIVTFFLCVALTAAGLFAWEWQLKRELSVQQAALNDLRQSFNVSDIVRVKEVEARLDTIARELDTQPAPSRLFSTLNLITLQTVQLLGFTISNDTGDQNTLLVTYQGLTDSYDSVLAQQQVMQSDPLLSGAEVLGVVYASAGADASDSSDDLVVTTESPVQFSVTLSVPMQAIMFSGNLPTGDPASSTNSPTEAAAAVEPFNTDGSLTDPTS